MNRINWKIANIIVGVFVVLFVFKTNEIPVQAKQEIKIYIDNKLIPVNGTKPFIEKGRVLIPLRVVQENMKSNVSWNNKQKQVTSKKTNGQETTTLIYKVDSPYLYKEYSDSKKNIDVKVEKIDVPVRLVNGHTVIPLRSATESFGSNIKWVSSKSAVYVYTGKTIKPKNNSYQYQVEGDISTLHPIELELFYLTNSERIKAGLKPLILDAMNSKVARIKSKDMHDKKYFDHNSPTFGTPFEMIKKYGITYRGAGENLAAGFETAAEVTKGWMESPGHRENLLRDNFERVGFGYYKGPNEYKRYYTQIFTTP